MGKTIFLLFFLFCIAINSRAQFAPEIPEEVEFFITDNVQSRNFIDTDELRFSERFNIHYDNTNIKFLIGCTIDDEVKKKLNTGELKYSIGAENLSKGFSRTNFSIPEINLSKDFYFDNNKLINPIRYFAKNWKRLSSKFFDFLISDETMFNDYCMYKLDEYVDKTASLLNLSEKEKTELSEKKILYVFCKNQDEIKNITGYGSRGQFVINYDAVVTTYPCHFHEVSHFLINYKLKNLPLYTLPFIQEGFAVATGGRGGQSANILNDVGYYLIQNNIADYKALFGIENFRNEDASVSYPMAGLFSKYLLSKNVDEYITFYRNYSGDMNVLSKIDPTEIDKNIVIGFENYLQGYKINQAISFSDRQNSIEVKVSKSFLLTPENPNKNYVSIKFSELFKGREYKGEKYYFAIDVNEINIYNLYSNELIASYVNSFSKTPVDYYNNGEFKFYIDKKLLDEDFNKLKISY